MMGLQDVFFKMQIPFDSEEAKEISARISEEIYFNALWASTELAEKNGAHDTFAMTRAAKGDLQFDLWGLNQQITSVGPAYAKELQSTGYETPL